MVGRFRPWVPGDPLVVAGYLLQYTPACLARGCSNPGQGDWEDHLLDGTFFVPPNPADHPAYQVDRWGDASKNRTDMDPVIEKPRDGDRAVITVDLPDGDQAAFDAKAFSYVQFRHVTLRLRRGAAFHDGLVRLVEYDDPDDLVGRTLYTVGEPESVPYDDIVVSADEAVFVADGRRIEIEMPACPDRTEADTELTCEINHGTFRGFTQDGRWDFDCDEGYLKDAAAGICTLACHAHTHPDDAGAECLVDDGYEWSIDREGVFAACAGAPVPNSDGSACVCTDDTQEPVELADGAACRKKCADPLMSRDEEGRCTCPEGSRKRGGQCVEIAAGPPATPRPARPAMTQADEGDEDSSDATACVDFSCFAEGAAPGAGGDGWALLPASGMAGGCSLTSASAAAGSGWLFLFLFVPIAVSRFRCQAPHRDLVPGTSSLAI